MNVWKNISHSMRALVGKPVQNDAYKIKLLRDTIKQVEWFDYKQEDWDASTALLEKKPPPFDDGAAKRIVWLLCNFEHPFGGVYTVLRIANELQNRGWDNCIIVYDNPKFTIDSQIQDITKYFPYLNNRNFIAFNGDERTLPRAECAVGTFWSSCYLLLKMKTVRAKAYLIQDFEPGFYAAGTTYALAENTYRMPFHRLFNTQGLMQYINTNYPQRQVRSLSFTPAVDKRYRFVQKSISRPVRVLFYARPNTPRNAFELVVAMARALKEHYGAAVQLVAAGERAGLYAELCAGVMEFVGVVDYEKLPQFYASFHVVVSFMLTKHPSYLPFEAMACGCAVIVNENEANTWLLRDGENCVVAAPCISSLLEAFEWLMQKGAYEHVVTNGVETVSQFRWNGELRRIDIFLKSL